MENKNIETGSSELKSLKTSLTDLSIRLIFWMVMISFIISFAIPLLGDSLGGIYLDFRDYFIDAPIAEKAGFSLFGLF
jgi:hypothetical protein